ncbi:MAG: hypothetical protein WKG01_30100 [Kofleriaceae bacterium]
MATRRLGYLDGIGATLGVIGLFVLLAFAASGGELARMYDELAGRPVTMSLVLHPAWRFGAPVVLAAAIVVGHLRVSRFGLLAIGITGAIVACFTYVAALAPTFALAGNISG